jgi:hypothetical protein
MIFPPTDVSVSFYESELRVISCSLDAQVAGRRGQVRYVDGYYDCVKYLHAQHFWERRLHLDILLAVLAPNLVPLKAILPTVLVCWCVGVGIGVYFHVAQNILRARLADILGERVRLSFVGFELANRLAPTSEVLAQNSDADTEWSVREDVLSVDLNAVPFIHDIHISLSCAPLSHTGGGGDVYAEVFMHEEFTMGSGSVDCTKPLISTPWADALVHSALVVGAVRIVNPNCSFVFETTANSRQHARSVVLDLFACVLGGIQLHAHVEMCKTTSAMLGERYFVTSASVAAAIGSVQAPTVQSIISEYLLTSVSAEEGVTFKVSTRQRDKILRLTSGFYASSTRCDGRGRFVGYMVAVDVWRNGMIEQELTLPLGFEFLSRLYGLRSWWLNPLGRFVWQTICSMVSGAVPAGTLLHVTLQNFNMSAFICARGEARVLVLGLPVMRRFAERLLTREQRFEFRLCTRHWMTKLGRIAGISAVVTISFTCTPLVKRARCRATIGEPVPLHSIADSMSRSVLIELADQKWLDENTGDYTKLVRHAFPIMILAIEDLDFHGCDQWHREMLPAGGS